MRPFLPHQKTAFGYASPKNRIALFKEMRTGKTAVVIRWAEEKGPRKRWLVLCPASSIPDWARELSAETVADEDIKVLKGPQRLMECTGTETWFLTTYESVQQMPEILNRGWDGIILDESTKIRNPRAKITKALRARKSSFRYRAILTGLPDPEHLLDYVEQVLFAFDEFMGCRDFWSFRARYFRQYGFEWICSFTTRKRITEELNKLAFYMTQKQAGIGSKKTYKIIQVMESVHQARLRKAVCEGYELPMYKNSYGEDTKWVPVKYQWLAQIASGFTPHGVFISGIKARRVLKLLQGKFYGSKVVIWFKHTYEIDYVAALLNMNGVKAVKYTGEDKTQEQEFRVGDARAICAQAKCAQFSKDWSMADAAIYYSNWWDGEVRAQTEQRIIHPKKKKPVMYIDLVTTGTIDEDTVKLVREKRARPRKMMQILAEKWKVKNVARD